MEKFTQKWAVISLLEDTAEGSEFYYTDFPLHITLAGVFAVEKNSTQLIHELDTLLAGKKRVEIEAEEQAMFGPAQDIAVMKVKKTPNLINLYSTIYGWLENAGAAYNSPEYQGEGYLPHVTAQTTGSLVPGEKRLLKSVSLIDLFPNNDGYRRKIFRTIDLQ